MAPAIALDVGQPTGIYGPRDSAQRVLYSIVRDHFETFRAPPASPRDGDGLPRFVEQEFRKFLSCGCGGRRMAERAAHLTTCSLTSRFGSGC
jgi:hypothetical protein